MFVFNQIHAPLNMEFVVALNTKGLFVYTINVLKANNVDIRRAYIKIDNHASLHRVA